MLLGVRAIRSSRSATSPPVQYGIPQAEYEVKEPRSKAVIRNESGPRRRRAWEAADMPAASAPMTTKCSAIPDRLLLRAVRLWPPRLPTIIIAPPRTGY